MTTELVQIPAWTPPAETKKEDLDWAPLHTLDLSKIQGEDFDQVPQDVVEQVGEAFSKDGFMYAVNHGLTHEQVLRQFAIGQYAFNNVSEEEKKRCVADMVNAGSFVGYKPMGHWQLQGVKDRIEQLNFGSQTFTPAKRERFPVQMQSLMDEIHEFARYNHDVILRKVLAVLSLVLKLPVQTLWNLSADHEKGLDLLRYALYRTPPKEDDTTLNGVRLQGHTDFNSVSILWSQPITSLEVLMPDDVWRTVRYRPNAIVLNMGDAIHFLSGGFLKPTIHRVVAPPEDQAHYDRLGLFYFALFNDDVELKPLTDSPVVRKAHESRNFWDECKRNGLPIPTAGEWERMRVRAYGQGGQKKGSDGHDHVKIAGVDVTLYNDTKNSNKRAHINSSQPITV
ncbi:hypothetical protein MVES1_000748 [Malassezia vespertilionis]|uniref:uncharacterized protein n=1 Tax=Malassezia vespertilionis TaxID=2020962 RepID=UPI0024B1F10A|nr:uncharacterized protein MVES1_000748 [Malassezia vespertilionis]WFD05418.1 hypothetical protein MVES1_000748 [Malassezia vespertilionis]